MHTSPAACWSSRAASAVLLQALTALALAAPAGDSAWPVVGGGLDAWRYSPLTEINRGTIAQLSGAWISQPFEDGASSRVTPVVQDGRMYLSAGVNVYALDAGSGRTLWSRRLGAAEDAKAAAGLMPFSHSENPLPNAQGLALGDGLIFVGTANGLVMGLDQADGRVVWSVSLRDAPRHPVQNISAAPIYAGGQVFVSVATVERYRGRVLALDAHTGHERWRFDVIPAPGQAGSSSWPSHSDAWQNGGGNVWLPPVVDTRLGLVYFGTGNASPIKAGERRVGDNLYTASVIALDIHTGSLRWHYQLVHHDLWEMDVATPLVLYPAATGPAIAAMRPDGVLFRLDAGTGRALFPVDERAVDQDATSATARTQPMPRAVDSILPECAHFQPFVPAGFVLDCNFAPPSSRRLNVLAPAYGVRVNPMSYSPQTGYLYAQGMASLEWRRRTADPNAYEQNGFNARVPGIDAARSRVLAAIDVRSGKIAWRRDLAGAGADAGGPSGAGGGYLSTAGGLLFRRSGDGAFTALDATSGEPVWRYWTGAVGGSASPISYSVGSRQYIAVVDNNVVRAFALNGGIAPDAEPPAAPPQPAAFFVGPIQNTKMIELVSLRQENPYQSGTRYDVDEYGPNPYRARFSGLTALFGNNGHVTHTIVAVDGSWTTGPIKPGDTAEVTFTRAGSYAYRCSEHPFTYGELIVGQSSSDAPARATDAGAEVYQRECASCHGADLRGGERGATALIGAGFVSRWHDKNARDLFDRTRSTMPATAPNSLTPADYLAVTDYLLNVNQLMVKPLEDTDRSQPPVATQR